MVNGALLKHLALKENLNPRSFFNFYFDLDEEHCASTIRISKLLSNRIIEHY